MFGYNTILKLLNSLIAEVKTTMATVQDIQDKLAKVKAAVDANNALLTQLSALIRANATDPATLQAIANGLDAAVASLQAADAANTPATPPATPNV